MNKLFDIKKTPLKYFKLNHSIFSGSKRGDFFQNEPKIGNQYDEDPFLIDCLKNSIPENVRLFAYSN